MKTPQILGLAIFIVGIMLLFFGYQSSQGLEDQLHETFTGRLTDSTMWMYISGAATAVIGLGLMLFKR